MATGMARAIKRKVRAAVPPLLFLLLVAYFLWNATQGDRGLRAYTQREADLRAAQTDLAGWERRVGALRTSRLDPDALDERARAMLNLSDPADIVVPYPPGQKLF
jgi:cell division protein FtsB